MRIFKTSFCVLLAAAMLSLAGCSGSNGWLPSLDALNCLETLNAELASNPNPTDSDKASIGLALLDCLLQRTLAGEITWAQFDEELSIGAEGLDLPAELQYAVDNPQATFEKLIRESGDRTGQSTIEEWLAHTPAELRELIAHAGTDALIDTYPFLNWFCEFLYSRFYAAMLSASDDEVLRHATTLGQNDWPIPQGSPCE